MPCSFFKTFSSAWRTAGWHLRGTFDVGIRTAFFAFSAVLVTVLGLAFSFAL